MRFATLGEDPLVQRIAARLVERGNIWAAGAGTVESEGSRYSCAERLADWQDLLHFEGLDWIVIGGDDPDRDDQLRKIVAAGTPLTVIHPACEAIVAIELEMIRDDVGTPLTALVPAANHPAFRRLVSHAQGAVADLGTIEQVVFSRPMKARDGVTVLRQLRNDSELIRQLVGRVRHVNAMGEAGKGAGFANLSVNMSSTKDVVVRWSVSPGDEPAAIVVKGSNSDATLTMADDAWRLAIAGAEESLSSSDGLNDAIDQLAETYDQPGKSPCADWKDVRHSLEVAEAAERSAIKGKTIELLEESYTEESSFKGLMAMGGCGLLLLTLLFMIVWSIVEGVRLPYKRNQYELQRAAHAEANPGFDPEGAPQSGESDWPLALRLWPVYPFAIFLLLQTLRLVFRNTASSKSPEPEPPPDN